MAGIDAGDQTPCPECGETVLVKSMIPVLAPDGSGLRYICRECAHKLVPTAFEPA